MLHMYATSAFAFYCSKWIEWSVCLRDLTELRIEKASATEICERTRNVRVATKAHSAGTIQCNHNLMLHKILHHVFVADFHLKRTHTGAALFICIPHCILRFRQTRNLCWCWCHILTRMQERKSAFRSIENVFSICLVCD